MRAESMWRVIGESETHRRLKERSLLWAYERGFRCCAMEVCAPRSSYRIDVAGIRVDRKFSESIVAIFECKQSRGDLFRDNRRQHELKTNCWHFRIAGNSLSACWLLTILLCEHRIRCSRNGLPSISLKSTTERTIKSFTKLFEFSANSLTTRNSI